MNHIRRSPDRGRRAWRRAAVWLAVVALGLAWFSLADRPEAPVEPGTSASNPADIPAPSDIPATANRTVDAHPTELRISAIDVDTPLIDLGMQPDGTVEVPGNPARAGWYEPGPAPGEAGSAAILGHVDSKTGPAVFYRLDELRAGERIDVVRADRSVASFTVRTVKTYPNADFPAEQVYRSKGRPSLTLVTCGGAYDKARDGYQANVVVVADLSGLVAHP